MEHLTGDIAVNSGTTRSPDRTSGKFWIILQFSIPLANGLLMEIFPFIINLYVLLLILVFLCIQKEVTKKKFKVITEMYIKIPFEISLYKIKSGDIEMIKSLQRERVDLSLWAKETCDGLMFLGTSVMKEEECLSKIKKGIELCDFIEKLDLVSADKEIPSIDVDTFITLKRVASNKSLLDFKSFKEIKEKTKEIKNALTEIIQNPSIQNKKLRDHQLIFSQLARLFVGFSS